MYQSGKERESLDAFRKGAACPELRLYGSTTTGALFKALDALRLTGRDRLAALSWMSMRLHNFYIIDLQYQRTDLSELARKADLATRKEISELLLVLGGHLFATNFQNRQFAEWAVHAAFRLKAEIAAAEKSPTMNGYVAVVRALVSVKRSWPDIEQRKETPLEVAQWLPSRIASCHETVDGFRCQGSECCSRWGSEIDGAIVPVFSDATAIHGPSERLVVLIERSELIGSWPGRPAEPGHEMDFPRTRGGPLRPTPDTRRT